jgi:hypothetical protein
MVGALPAADDFDIHVLDVLKTAPTAGGAKRKTEIGFNDIALAPRTLAGGAAFLVVKTDDGNWAKLTVRQGALKVKSTPGALAPFLWIERLTTYAADPRRGVKAERKDVYLFDGFGVDLDSGQVVPAGLGEDLVFRVDAKPAAPLPGAGKSVPEKGMMTGNAGGAMVKGKVVVAKGAECHLLSESLVEGAPKRKGRRGATTGGDYDGEYRLDADGRWTGSLKLSADDNGSISGTFVSEQSGATYEVAGQIGRPAHQFKLRISFPQSALELEGFRWTKGGESLAGTALLDGKPFGFVATRKK